MVHLGDVSPPIWDQTIEKMEAALEDIDFQGEDILPDWRKTANRRKFDRELFEKYGFFKDVILHPQFQQIKHFLEERASTEVLVGEPLLPLSTAVIVLFLLHKRVSHQLLALAALFVFSVNPFYVVLGGAAWWVFDRRRPRGYQKVRKLDASTYIPTLLGGAGAEAEEEAGTGTGAGAGALETQYDHVLIGGDLGTLYTAALLSKCGHRCVVLQPTLSPLLEIHPEGAPCPAPVMNVCVGKIERYQALVDAAQHSLSPPHRVTFRPLGTEQDGYTSAVLVTGGLGAGTGSRGRGGGKRVTTCLRVGEQSLATDLSARLPLDKSLLTLGLARLTAAMSFLTSHLIGRCVVPDIFEKSAVAGTEGAKLFKELLAKRTAEQVIHNSPDVLGCAAEVPEALTVLESLASRGAEEGVPSAYLAGYCLAHALSTAQGAFYPAGGAPALAATFARTVAAAGGAVYQSVALKEVLLEEVGANNEIQATGVAVSLNSPSQGGKGAGGEGSEVENEVVFSARKSVISGLGVVATYTKLLPPETLSAGVRGALGGQWEARPKIQVVFWLRGSALSLGLSSSDLHCTPSGGDVLGGGAGVEGVAGAGERDAYAAECVHVWSPSAKDPTWEREHPSVQVVVVEFEACLPHLQAAAVPLPPLHLPAEGDRVGAGVGAGVMGAGVVGAGAGDDFSFTRVGLGAEAEAGAGEGPTGPVVYCSAAHDASHPSHPLYANTLSFELSLSKSKRDKFQARAESVLKTLYPRIFQPGNSGDSGNSSGDSGNSGDCVLFATVVPPVLRGGGALSNGTAKYCAELSAVTEIKRFFLTGRDLGTVGLAGDLQGGWAGANAALGYTLAELSVSHNVVSDLNAVQ